MKSNCFICNKEFNSRIDSRYKNRTKCCSMECRNKYLSVYNVKGLKKIGEDGRLLCYKCEQYKPPTDFYERNGYGFTSSRDMKSTSCRLCQNESNDKVRNRDRQTISGTLRHRLKTAKSCSKSRNIFFDSSLRLPDLLDIYNNQKGICPVSGQIMTIGTAKCSTTLSLDRISSNEGYTKSNIQLVCWAVNQMKNDYSIEELIKWCKLIVDNNKTEVYKQLN